MIRTTKQPNDHFVGKWERGKKYTLYSVVKNNGTFFRAVSAKEKGEPYVIYNAETGVYSANEGWEIVYMSEDSRISSGTKKTVTVSDITGMTKDQLDSLDVGDCVIKVTGNQRHLYLVTYKGDGENEGICLSYNASGYGETVSYDRSDGGWSYNSTDINTYGD